MSEILTEQKHEWNKTELKPWTCKLCGTHTANLRHIENGYCRHDWDERVGMKCCIRCGIVANDRNQESPCIGAVKLDLRGQNGMPLISPSRCRMCEAKDSRLIAQERDNEALRKRVAELESIQREQEQVVLDAGPITCRNGLQHERHEGCLYCERDAALELIELSDEERNERLEKWRKFLEHKE